MIDFSNPYLAQIEAIINKAVESSSTILAEDIDAKEIIYQLGEELRIKRVTWTDGLVCVPNVLRILMYEDKANREEDVERLFNSAELLNLLTLYLAEQKLHILMPLRAETELLSRGSSRLMYSTGRITLTLDWPLAEEADVLDIVIDDVKKQILAVQERKPAIPQVGRLMALNADVYRNNFLITKEITYIGRMRVVRDESGMFVRKNDFVFSQVDDAEAISNSVSRSHARIEYRNGKFWLSDLGSANRTWIERGEQKILVEKPEALEDGDILVLGKARVKFNILDQLDLKELALQQAAQRTISKVERRTPMKTTIIQAYKG
ncbi:MAG: FHA domain-containing protein [Acidobacteriota bacterium]|nr:FHA domain-containing protein [Blastocatellia bacterium]MDW8412319.1 FHA domain-containing protein [Acidobacteriota bacterium]